MMTLGRLVLEAIRDATNEAYLEALQDYLKRLRLLYEKGEIGEQEYRVLEAQALGAMKSFRARERGTRRVDISL